MLGMIGYINAIKRQMIDQYGFPENPDMPGCVLGDVPDGIYPMTIDGKLDNVRITDGKISCGNYEDTTGK
jgi:hypothetical protein